MTWNGYQRGEDDGPSECDGRYHSDGDMVAALSTRWYESGRQCKRMIRITSTQNGRTVEAKVVDECDSNSLAAWKALGLHVNVGEALVTWSDA
ncbi:hypothetical protein CFC21_082321 [Triticum aestivum]|uniref:Uncharacterized protein n=2 Tax=Triticum aestivum TaxID=4565 RepID=A0A9R1I678_WHEAT|nr:hypothetical protein CFC21_082321 [Triticum aestivum]